MAYWDHPRRGILIPDTRFTAANEVTADATGDESAPKAGGLAEPDSTSARLAIETLGDQDTDLVYQVEQGGHPQLGAGVRYSYRTSSEASTARRGWNAPNLITGWTAADYSTTANTMVCALAMANGQILVAYRNGSTTAYFQTYTPDTDTWSGTIAFPTTVHATGGIALAQMPEGNVVVMFRESGGQWRIYRYSIADAVSGGSWVLHASDMLDTEPGTASTWTRLIITPSGDWAYFYAYSNALWQYASNSAGAAFTRVVAGAPTAATDGDAIVTPTGKILVHAVTGGAAYAYTIGSPWTPYTSVTGVATGAGTGEVWLTADPVGRVLLYLQESTPSNIVAVAHSDNDGATWTTSAFGVLAAFTTADTTTYLTGGQAVHAGGAAWMVHQFVDGTETEDASVCMMRLGGWSSATIGAMSASYGNVTDDIRLAPGVDTVSFARGRVLIPYAIPSSITGFTVTDPGAGTATTTAGRVQIDSGGTTYYWDHSTNPAAGDSVVAMARWNMASAGSATAHNAGLVVRLTSTSDYEVGIYLTSTGFVVYDVVAGSALATVTTTTSSDFDVMVYFVPGAHLWVGYKAVTASTWTEAHEGGATTGAVSTGRYIRWGTSSASTTTHSYRFAWAISIASSYTGRAFAASSSATYSGILGRSLTSLPAPIDKRSAYGRKQSYVRGKDGPGRVTDTFQARTRADYPREAIMWQHQPSPRVSWKSTSTTAQTMAWAPAGSGVETKFASPLIAMAVLNTNVPVHTLYGYTSGAYALLGTLTLTTGFAGLSYTRTGNVILCPGSGVVSSRYVMAGEFVGASIDLGGGKVRRIERHTEGVWTYDSRRVEIVLATEGEGAYDGTEGASGTMSIIAHSGVLVVPQVEGPYSKLKWVAVGGADVTGAAYRTGQVLIGSVQVMGQQWDWGYTADYAVPTVETETRPGVVRRSAVAPVGRTWSVGWTEGVDQSHLRRASTTVTPDYLATATVGVAVPPTLAEATRGDVPFLLAGLLSATRGGEVPCVVLPKLPTSATSITDPTLFLYGRMAPEIRIENVQGDEGSNEVYRVSSLAVREIT